MRRALESSLLAPDEALVPLLCDGELDSSALGQGDVRLAALADDEDVAEAGGEGVAVDVLDVDDVEGPGVALAVHDGAHPPGVPPAGHHAHVAGLELDEVHDLARVEVEADGVVDLDDGIGVADGPAVAGVQVGHVLGASPQGLDAAQLVLGLLVRDPGEEKKNRKR